MAYQDGFYGAADLYVSIYLRSLRPPRFPLLPVGFQCEMTEGPNP